MKVNSHQPRRKMCVLDKVQQPIGTLSKGTEMPPKKVLLKPLTWYRPHTVVELLRMYLTLKS